MPDRTQPFRINSTELGFLLSALNKLAEEFNVAVYLTNQVQADSSGAQSFVADPFEPSVMSLIWCSCV